MKSVLCYGDSNTWGYSPTTRSRLPKNVRWTGILQTELGADFYIIEEGLNGRTTVWEDPVERVMSGKDYLLPCLKSHAPLDFVVIMLGINDLKKKYALSPRDIALGVRHLVSIVECSSLYGQNDKPRIIVLIPPSIKEIGEGASMFEGGEENSKTLSNEFIKEFQHDDIHLIDASKFLTTSEIDGIHLDKDAHQLLGHEVAIKISECK